MNQIHFIANVNKQKHPGIYNKCADIFEAITRITLNSSLTVIPEPGIKGAFLFIRAIARNKSKVILVRFAETWVMALALPILIYQRSKGTRIIGEVPTPMCGSINELIKSTNFLRKPNKQLKILLIYLFGPIVYFPFHKILQYSIENKYFSLFSREKTVLISNYYSNKKHFRRISPSWPNRKLNLIGVGNISNWHAYDRILNGIKAYYDMRVDSNIDILFRIVGDGQEITKLKQLTKRLRIENYVQFYEAKSPKQLLELYQESHIGISTLGVHRWGLEHVSPLKSREYSANSLPFIYTGTDIAYKNAPLCVCKKVDAHDNNIIIIDLIEWYSTQCASQLHEIRLFFEENLSLEKNIYQYINSH